MNETSKEKTVGSVVMLSVSTLIPNRSQPRREFGNEAMRSLSESIRENGIIQPICVRRCGELYEIISGERRMRAARIAGMSEVPCIIMDASDEKAAVLALIENIQRKDLNYFEEAAAIVKLITAYGLTQEEAALRLGKAQSTIANKIRLLKFTEAEQRILITANLTERQARAIIRIPDPELRRGTLDKVVRGGLNLEQTERLVNTVIEDNERVKKEEQRRRFLPPPHSKMYINSLNALLKRIKDDNIPCEITRETSEDCCEYTIRFPINQ